MLSRSEKVTRLEIEVYDMEIAPKIKEFIENHIVSTDDNFELKVEDKIFELGFLDSMFALKLVEFIEETFGIDVTDKDLDIQNFSSVNNIVAFINSKGVG
jgi:acyl carrier protein